jgi:hypothetical protein
MDFLFRMSFVVIRKIQIQTRDFLLYLRCAELYLKVLIRKVYGLRGHDAV